MSAHPTRRSDRRRLGMIEYLEGRQLMAADLFGSAFPAASPAGGTPHLPAIDLPVVPAEIQLDDVLPDRGGPAGIDLDDILPSLDPVIGTWTNVNPNTGGITKIQITNSPSGHKVEAWGNCLPSDCEWGKTDLDLLGTSVSDTTPDYALGSWDHGFKDATLTIDLNGRAGRVADLYNVFTDGSDRENYHQRYLLTDSGDLIELNDFGNNQLANVLIGGWVNSDPNTGGLSKLAVSQSIFGNASIQAWGACVPTECEWGAVPLNPVGSSVTDATPEYAVANYEFDFKSTFITSRFDDGDLIVGTYHVFHDGSDRSNYFSEQRMWKLGDANHDGEFTTSDLVQVMQAGEYEDGLENNSSWEEGDFNRDGDFNTSDLVAAFECGGYEAGGLTGKIKLPDLFPLPKLEPMTRFESIASAIDDIFSAENVDDVLLVPFGPRS